MKTIIRPETYFTYKGLDYYTVYCYDDKDEPVGQEWRVYDPKLDITEDLTRMQYSEVLSKASKDIIKSRKKLRNKLRKILK